MDNVNVGNLTVGEKDEIILVGTNSKALLIEKDELLTDSVTIGDYAGIGATFQVDGFATPDDEELKLGFGEREALTMALFKLMDDDSWVLQKMAVHRNQNGVAVLRVLMHSCGEPITAAEESSGLSGAYN